MKKNKYLDIYKHDDYINEEEIDYESLSFEDKYYLNCALAKKYLDTDIKKALRYYENLSLLKQLSISSKTIYEKLETKDENLKTYIIDKELKDFKEEARLKAKIIKETKRGDRNTLFYIVSALLLIVLILSIEFYLDASRLIYIFAGITILILDIFIVPRLEEQREEKFLKELYAKDEVLSKMDYAVAKDYKVAEDIKHKYSHLL